MTIGGSRQGITGWKAQDGIVHINVSGSVVELTRIQASQGCISVFTADAMWLDRDGNGHTTIWIQEGPAAAMRNELGLPIQDYKFESISLDVESGKWQIDVPDELERLRPVVRFERIQIGHGVFVTNGTEMRFRLDGSGHLRWIIAPPGFASSLIGGTFFLGYELAEAINAAASTTG
ncbi:MAG TPA: hypothetical protein DHV25_03765 [Candidatus Kerfeldbacteria bacterium]|nr:hypothetical protein [Candidatus Kerfeldbacteria bacterium]